MFISLTNTATDLFNITVPILKYPPEKRINLEELHRPFERIDRIENILASNMSSAYVDYLKQITLNNISMGVFPNEINLLPAIIYVKDNINKGIILNVDVCSAYLDMDKNRIMVKDFNNLTASILFGLTKLILYDANNESILNSLYFAMSAFCYSLLMRCYMRDFDMMRKTDQELGTIFYLIAKLVCKYYFNFQGNERAIAFGALRRFFSKEKDSKIRFNIDTDKLPTDNITLWNDIFRILSEYNIMPGITVDDFRNRITRQFGATCTICSASGYELAAMMNTVNIKSDIFFNRVETINPSAIKVAKNAISTHLKDILQTSNKEADVIA